MEKQQHDDVEAQRPSTCANTEPGKPPGWCDDSGSLHLAFQEPTSRPIAQVATEFRTLSLQLSRTDLSSLDLGSPEANKKRNVQDFADIQWHQLSPAECFNRLGSSLNGIDWLKVEKRRKVCGRNEMSKPPNRILRRLFWYIFGGFGSLLIFASIICFLAWKPLGNPDPQASNLALAIVLLVVVLIQTIFNAIQDFSTSKIMASIAVMLPEDVLVTRGTGQFQKVPAAELVPGDIVIISTGNKVAADCRIIECSGVKFDRSVVTGEAEAINGTVDCSDENYLESHNIALAGTCCVAGTATCVVVSTGDETVFGRIAKLSNKSKPGLTTLEREVRFFVFVIAFIAITIAVICAIIWGSFLHIKHPDFMNVSTLLVNLVSAIVAFIPEGMPVAVTLSLSIVARKLAKAKVLCKQLSTCETLGAISVLCSDKTGTLTTNSMTVANIGTYELTTSPRDARDIIVVCQDYSSVLKQIQCASAVCNAASFETGDVPVADRRIFGDATDCAILKMAEEMSGVDEITSRWSVEHQIPFNSKNKFMLRLVRPTQDDAAEEMLGKTLGPTLCHDSYLLLCKGAPDVLLPRASYALNSSGEPIPLTQELKQSIVNVQHKWSSEGQRVLVVARKILRDANLCADIETSMDDLLLDLNCNLTIIGLIGIVDPPRPDTRKVVKVCRGAGIRFFMVTGDFQVTAEAIARSCGIITARTIDHFDDLGGDILPIYVVHPADQPRDVRAISLTGTDISSLTDELWERVCRYEEIIFSRTTPDQKLRIVTEFQARGECVGMTGDGVNDAPSLKQADIGVALGSGSSVAMEAADMILLDSFSSIITAILHGRLLFVNLKKTIGYLLPAGTMAELWTILLSFFFGLPQILSNLQMIFVCIGTDLFPSLSLVQEQPESDLLLKTPRNVKKDRLCDWKLLFQAYFIVGIPVTIISGCMGFWWMSRKGIPFSDMWLKYGGGSIQTNRPEYFEESLYEANAIYFFTLVLLQWFNLFGWRTQRLSSLFQQTPIFKRSTQNLYLFPAMAFALLLAVFLSYIPGLQHVFLTRGIAAEYFFLPMAFGTGLLTIDELRKLFVRKYPTSYLAKAAW